jgi:hypothetical protein
MRTKARSRLGRVARSLLGPFVLCPTPTFRPPLSHSRLRSTAHACAATEAPAALLAEPKACLGLADLQARMAQLRAACAESHAMRAACRANNALTPQLAPYPTTFHAAHESRRARRRYAATVGALTARNEKLVAANTELTAANANLTAANTNLETTISALSAENSKLAAQCGAVVDATSEALRQEGTARTHERALSSL